MIRQQNIQYPKLFRPPFVKKQMHTEKSSPLLIISLPFYRIAKVLLSDVLLSHLRKNHDIAIVSPFSHEPGFQKQFGGPRTQFLRWQQNELSAAQGRLLSMSEIARIWGYWRRFRKQGMSYYSKNMYTDFGTDGNDRRGGPLKCAVIWAVSSLGIWSGTWRLIESLMGKRWIRFEQLSDLSRGYDRVTLIQSANWGTQDRVLAKLSKLHGWRSVMIPYTSDQLDVNGYLLNDYDAICVQGSYEYERARHLHGVSPARIHRLGSVWFRYLDRLSSRLHGAVADDAEGRPTVIYAGAPRLFFPRQSEYEAVDALLVFLVEHHKDVQLIYRPLDHWDKADKADLISRYQGREGISVQWPSNASIGLDRYVDESQERSLIDYIMGLRGCRLLVMSGVTSLAMDIAYLEKAGLIANFADGTGTLHRRSSHLLNMDGLPGIRVVTSIPALLDNARELLQNSAAARQEAADTLLPWDYKGGVFGHILEEAVSGQTQDSVAGQRAENTPALNPTRTTGN